MSEPRGCLLGRLLMFAQVFIAGVIVGTIVEHWQTVKALLAAREAGGDE